LVLVGNRNSPIPIANSRAFFGPLRLIGDVVLTTPAIRALRETYPHARLSYLVEPLSAPIVQRNPHLDDVIVAAAPDAPRRFATISAGVRSAAAALRPGHRFSRRPAQLVVHLGITRAAPNRLRGAPRAWMYTTRVPRTRELRPRHSVQNQWDLLEPLGIPRPRPTRIRPS
jgi:ADP-heptose:LPS heptosyltransferase